MSQKPIIAVVGRPNVGKSTLVNRLVGSRQSIVHDLPGVTRDRIYFDAKWQDKEFTLIDTGGIIPNDEDEIMKNIFAQVELACEEADKILFLVDGKDGLNEIDKDIANLLRRTKKNVYLVVNKIDSIEKAPNTSEFYELALGEPMAVSALHGSGGVGDMLDIITEDFKSIEEIKNENVIKLAIVGKPNAGKSSIVNAVLGKERVITSEISGTTRDSINSSFKYEKQDFIIVDTAGIRKKSKVDWGVEKFAVDRAIRSIRECDVALLVIDAIEGITDQDKKIAQTIVENGKGMILAINKWDLIENKKSNTLSDFEKKLGKEVPFLSFVPKIFISAKTKQRIFSIFKEAITVYSEGIKRPSTSLVNRVVQEAYVLTPPVSVKGKKLKIYYTTQANSAPPTFILFINSEKLLQDTYKKYLEKKLREAFGFYGNPVKINAREKSESK